ncbi:MAG: methyltransferase [Candidatus Aminicenantales bacterium]
MKYFWVIFAIGSVLLLWFSWTVSLRARRYHGIARFFAFESILLLFLLNVRFWFHEPFSVVHILAWLCLILSLFLAVHGVYLLIKLGRPDGQLENTTRLVVRGAYKFIRHPLYASIAFLGLGIFLKRVTVLTSVLAGVVLVSVYLTAKIEEREMLAKFGNEYAAYRTGTKMFLPFVL